jgi:transposase
MGQAYYHKRIASGASTTEALRCLKRRLARVVFHHLHTDHQNQIQPCQPAAA